MLKAAPDLRPIAIFEGVAGGIADLPEGGCRDR